MRLQLGGHSPRTAPSGAGSSPLRRTQRRKTPGPSGIHTAAGGLQSWASYTKSRDVRPDPPRRASVSSMGSRKLPYRTNPAFVAQGFRRARAQQCRCPRWCGGNPPPGLRGRWTVRSNRPWRAKPSSMWSKKADAGLQIGFAGAIQRQRQGDLGFPRVARYRCRACHSVCLPFPPLGCNIPKTITRPPRTVNVWERFFTRRTAIFVKFIYEIATHFQVLRATIKLKHGILRSSPHFSRRQAQSKTNYDSKGLF